MNHIHVEITQRGRVVEEQRHQSFDIEGELEEIVHLKKHTERDRERVEGEFG